MVTRVQKFSAVLIILLASLMLGCAGMGVRYAQNYSVYTAAKADCAKAPKPKVTVPQADSKNIVIELPDNSCDRIAPPRHDMEFAGPMIGTLGGAALNSATTLGAAIITTNVQRDIVKSNNEARIAESTNDAAVLIQAFDSVGNNIDAGGDVAVGGDVTKPPAEMLEGL